MTGKLLSLAAFLVAWAGGATAAEVRLSVVILPPTLFADATVPPPQLVLEAGGREAARIGGSAVAGNIRAGRYSARVEWAGSRLPLAPLQVTDDRPTAVDVTLSPARLTVTPSGAPQGGQVVWRVLRIGSKQQSLEGEVFDHTMPPGEYGIEATSGNRQGRARVTLDAGSTMKLTLPLKER